MKFIHTADWHIGGSKNAVGEEYLTRQLGVLDSIVNIAVDRGIDTIVVAGDIFDTDEPEPHEKEAFLEKMLSYDRMGLRFLVIRGNHDQGSMTGKTAIRYLSHMTDYGVFKHSVFTERTRYVRVGDTVFILLCHNPRYFKSEAESAISAIKSGSLTIEYKHLVLVCHEAFRGSLSDTNYRMTHGSEVLTVGEDVSTDARLTYTAVGDIHVHQKIASCTYYSGSPLQVKFGDKWPKGVLVVDTDHPDSPEFVSVRSKQLIKVTSLENIPKDAYVKLEAAATDIAQAQASGQLPDNVVKLQAIKGTMAIEYKENLDLMGRVMTALDQVLDDEDDRNLGKREATALMSAAGVC